jgi:hypothetical protein
MCGRGCTYDYRGNTETVAHVRGPTLHVSLMRALRPAVTPKKSGERWRGRGAARWRIGCVYIRLDSHITHQGSSLAYVDGGQGAWLVGRGARRVHIRRTLPRRDAKIGLSLIVN